MPELIIRLNMEDIRKALLDYIGEFYHFNENLQMENLVILDWKGNEIITGNVEEITVVYTHQK